MRKGGEETDVLKHLWPSGGRAETRVQENNQQHTERHEDEQENETKINPNMQTRHRTRRLYNCMAVASSLYTHGQRLTAIRSHVLHHHS